jgi:hypothetical protein
MLEPSNQPRSSDGHGRKEAKTTMTTWKYRALRRATLRYQFGTECEENLDGNIFLSRYSWLIGRRREANWHPKSNPTTPKTQCHRNTRFRRLPIWGPRPTYNPLARLPDKAGFALPT